MLKLSYLSIGLRLGVDFIFPLSKEKEEEEEGEKQQQQEPPPKSTGLELSKWT